MDLDNSLFSFFSFSWVKLYLCLGGFDIVIFYQLDLFQFMSLFVQYKHEQGYDKLAYTRTDIISEALQDFISKNQNEFLNHEESVYTCFQVNSIYKNHFYVIVSSLQI